MFFDLPYVDCNVRKKELKDCQLAKLEMGDGGKLEARAVNLSPFFLLFLHLGIKHRTLALILRHLTCLLQTIIHTITCSIYYSQDERLPS